jgi:hypothetical protein
MFGRRTVRHLTEVRLPSIMQQCDLQIARSESLRRQAALGHFKMKLESVPETGCWITTGKP